MSEQEREGAQATRTAQAQAAHAAQAQATTGDAQATRTTTGGSGVATNGAAGGMQAARTTTGGSGVATNGAAGNAGGATHSSAQAGAPKKPRKKAGIIAGVIVAMIVVAGAGFWVWHEQPSFCNAICHSPMDYYVESYESGNDALGVTVHAKANTSCLDCHEAVLTTQIAEVMAWVSDTYPMDADHAMLATGTEFASEEFCARSGCHIAGNTFDEITASLWGFSGNEEKYNPHASHQDLSLECSDCHGIHEQNVLVCNECHDLNMPNGWEAPHEL